MSENVQPREASAEEVAAINAAREMAAAGIPVFVCPPNPYRPGKFFFKAGWQHTVADPAALDEWQPGWGVAAVGGGAADFLDVDPRAGGQESAQLLKAEGAWPLTFGTQSTPSGGTHHIISRTGERKETGFLPGLDFQAGGDVADEKGSYGRAFVWLAPTVGVSKTTGELVPYRWVDQPDTEMLNEYRREDGSSSDESTAGVVSRVHAHRVLKSRMTSASAQQGIAVHSSAQPSGAVSDAVAGLGGGSLFGGTAPRVSSETRSFTWEAAQAFTAPLIEELKAAPIGLIEERGMALTLALEHFVPNFLTPGQAFAVVEEALSHTAYDPHGPSDWTADKFLERLDGRRPVLDSWKAERAVEAGDYAAAGAMVPEDAVEALLAEMLTPGQLKARPPKRSLIKGLLHLDSESWLIGAPGSRKSFVALDMAGHVAAGREWQGLRVHQGPVVIIAAEGGGGIGGRVAAWEREHGAMPDTVYVLPRPVQASDMAGWGVLARACERLCPVLIILDTQARMSVGLKENDATDMGIFIAAVGALRATTGACVMPIHHTGRTGGDARGSSALDGAQDTELKVVALPQRLRGELRVEKQKEMVEREPMRLIFARHEVGVDEDGDVVTSLALRPPGAEPWEAAVAEDGGAPVATRPGESVRVREPQGWTWALVPESGAQYVVRRQLLQALADIAPAEGLSKAEARKTVGERWYSEHGATARSVRGVDAQTWARSWDAVAALVDPASGESVAVDGRGGRKIINPVLNVTGE